MLLLVLLVAAASLASAEATTTVAAVPCWVEAGNITRSRNEVTCDLCTAFMQVSWHRARTGVMLCAGAGRLSPGERGPDSACFREPL